MRYNYFIVQGHLLYYDPFDSEKYDTLKKYTYSVYVHVHEGIMYLGGIHCQHWMRRDNLINSVIRKPKNNYYFKKICRLSTFTLKNQKTWSTVLIGFCLSSNKIYCSCTRKVRIFFYLFIIKQVKHAKPLLI